MPALGEICRRYGVKQLMIFGSATRGNLRPDSDLDFLVEFQPDVHIGLIGFLKLRDELSDLFQRPVDLVPRKGLKPLLKEEVLSTAEPVYAA
jgi:predicted nucleotidyltransferase